MRDIIKKIVARACRFVVISAIGSEGQAQVQRLAHMGVDRDKSATAYPYGMSSRAPVGTGAIQWRVTPYDTDSYHMPVSKDGRLTLESGEVSIFHPETGNAFHFKSDGSIECTSVSDIHFECAGDFNVDATGSINLVSDSDVLQSAPSILINGSITQTTGDGTGTSDWADLMVFNDAVEARDALTVYDSIRDAEVDLNHHTHLYYNDSTPVQTLEPQD